MDRLSPLDATFLHIEDSLNHMHIASCATFEGPPPSYQEVVEHFASRLPLVPRYRQRVRFVPGALGRPVWVDDPHFRIEYHVRHTSLPHPGDDEQLRRLMGRLMSQALDRDRPLWEAWLVEGLGSGEWALISKVHHCMVDGISGTELMAAILDPDREGRDVPDDHWTPAHQPSGAELMAEALSEALASPAELGRWIRSAARRPRRVAAELSELFSGARSMTQRLRPNTQLSIEGTIGPHRRWAWARTSLAEVKSVRAALGGTVNDVVLAAITNGYRELLLSREDPIDETTVVRSLVPVSVRAKGDATYNNQVSGMIAELPVGIADPVERLESIKAQMKELKESHQAVAAGVLVDLAEFTPPALMSLGTRAATAFTRRIPQRSVNTVTTNVPGPQVPIYLCGREMLEYFPFVPIGGGLRTGVAILSYNGKVGFGVTGDWDTVPDLEVLAVGIEHGMAQLLRAASAPPVASRKTGAKKGGPKKRSAAPRAKASA
jgi:WS/DGAT/MGAT family acyltransferase